MLTFMFTFKKYIYIKEIPVLQSLSNTVKGLQTVRLATLSKRDPRTGFQNQLFLDPLQNRCS